MKTRLNDGRPHPDGTGNFTFFLTRLHACRFTASSPAPSPGIPRIGLPLPSRPE